MKILSLITHPSVISKPMWHSFIFRTQMKMFLMKFDWQFSVHSSSTQTSVVVNRSSSKFACKNKWSSFLCYAGSVEFLFSDQWILNSICSSYKAIKSLQKCGLTAQFFFFFLISYTITLWTYWSVKVSEAGRKASSKTSYFLFWRWMNVLRVWNDMRVSNYWQNFHFWVYYPFNVNDNNCIK